MALSYDVYAGDGATTNFSFTHSYIETADVEVYLEGVLQVVTTDYTWFNATTIQFNSAPAGAEVIKFQRRTTNTARLVDFQDAGNLTEADLDLSADQTFYLMQEAQDDFTDNSMSVDTDDKWDASSKIIKNVTDPTSAQDAATKAYGDANWGGTSAAAAAASAAAAAADVLLTNADVVLTGADVVLTNADVVLTHADVVLTAADVVQTAADVVAAAAVLASAQPLDTDLTAIAALAQTKGNVMVSSGAAWTAVGVGANDTVLTAASGEASGVKWAAPAAGLEYVETWSAAAATIGENTSIPSTTTHIRLICYRLSVTGVDEVVSLTVGSTSGYGSSGVHVVAELDAAMAVTTSAAGWADLIPLTDASAVSWVGIADLYKNTASDTWTVTSMLSKSSSGVDIVLGTGYIGALAATLDRIKVTTSAGTFDGSSYIELYYN